MINKYPGTCQCGTRVEAGAGETLKIDGRWAVRCGRCQPQHAPAADWYDDGRTIIAPVQTDEVYTLLSGHVASPYQAAVFDHFRYGRGSRIIKAVAGSGKTTTMKNAIRWLPERAHVQLLAFNVEATDQLKEAIAELEALGEKSYKNVRANSFNSLGMGAVRRFLALPDAEVKVEADKVRKLLRTRLEETEEGAEVYSMYSAFATKLVGLAKGEGIGCLLPDIEAEWYRLVDHHGLYLDSQDASVEQGVALARKLLGWSNDAARTGWLDFDDQLYLVVKWKLRLWRNDVVVVDECFVPETPILTGLNGEQKTIRELYEIGYGGPIVSWSPEKGTHLSKIVGVKRVPVGKPMVKIRTRQRGNSLNGTRLSASTEGMRFGTRTLVCTEDHKIWTSEGWVSAGSLQIGMTVKHETVAPIIRGYQSRYAHSSAGRKALKEKAEISRFGSPFIPKDFSNRGGNGRGLSKHENLMLERLGEGWQGNYVIRTGVKRKNFKNGAGWHGKGATFTMDLPTNFKVDIVNIERRIVIEVDGASHNSIERQKQDAKKDNWLKENGWTVIRIKNEEVKSMTDAELRNRLPACPVGAEVISVESWVNRKHEYVYDLSVEDTHCYFAHGLLVHNCQDTNPVQRAILHLALKDGGRLYAVGDEKQAIYGFRGASSEAMALIAQEFRTAELPLTVSYRCARAIVERAQTWVPYIEPAETAPTGSVLDDLPLAEALSLLGPEDAILCRQTAPLVSVAYGMIARGRACRILGREIGEGLVNLIEQQRAKGLDRLIEKLENWREREMAKFIARGEENRAEAVADRVNCVLVIAEALPETERTVPALTRRIQSMFVDPKRGEKQSVLTLATVHKSKGKEWMKVAILRPELMPSKAARQDWQIDQETHLQYVAATRAKDTLIYCADSDMSLWETR